MALPVGLVRLGAPKDHEAAIGLRELGVFLLGAIRWVAGLRGKLLDFALFDKGATDVTPNGSIVL